MDDDSKNYEKLTNDPGLKIFMEKSMKCFNAHAVAYLTLHKGHSKWSCYDLGGFEMALMLAAKDYGVDYVMAYALAKYPDVLR